MFSFLGDLSPALADRYQTVERNIRAAGNSFFDAYLGLAEELLRTVLQSSGAELPPRQTAGELIRYTPLRTCLLGIGVEEATLGKLGDYILKINRHKHAKENAWYRA